MGISGYFWVFMVFIGIYSRLKPMSETNQSVKIILGGTHNSRIFLVPLETWFVHLQKLKNPGFSRAALPFFSRAFPGFLEAQNENNVHNELF